jgi:HSP20 family protein
MANLTQWDNPRQELFDIRRNFDDFFNRFLSWPFSQEERTFAQEFSPAIESFIDTENKRFHCQVLLPGVEPKNVNIQVQGNTLTVSGERTNTRETKEADFLHREISYGSFTRSLMLPEGVDKEKIAAEYKNGTLEITAPMSSAALPRKIEVKSIPVSKAAGA